MKTVLLAIRCLVLFVSYIGLLVALRRRLKIRIELCPILLAACIVTLVYIGGLLNIMQFTAYLICAAGLVLFVVGLVNRKTYREDFRSLFNPTFLILAGILVFLLNLMVRVRIGPDTDTSAFWLPLVRTLWFENKLPHYLGETLSHPSYPPGAAIFIYYIGRIAGVGETVALFSQSSLIAFGLCTLGAFAPDKKAGKTKLCIYYVVLAFACITMFFYHFSNVYDSDFHNYPTPLSLAVDPLLGATALAHAAFIIKNRTRPRMNLLCAVPFLTLTVFIKDAGILFALVNSVLLFMTVYKNPCNGDQARRCSWTLILVCLLLPWGLRILYVRYLDLAYAPLSSIAGSRHAVSLEYFKYILGKKNASDAIQTLRDFFSILFSLKTEPTRMWLLFNAVLVTFIFLNKETRKESLRAFIFLNALWCIYTLGVALALVLTFDTRTCERFLYGFASGQPNRYFFPIVLYTYGTLLCLFGYLLKETTLSPEKMIVLICCAALLARPYTGITRVVQATDIACAQNEDGSFPDRFYTERYLQIPQ